MAADGAACLHRPDTYVTGGMPRYGYSVVRVHRLNRWVRYGTAHRKREAMKSLCRGGSRPWSLAVASVVGLLSCGTEPELGVRVTTDFEGGSLGSQLQVADQTFHLTLRYDTNSEFIRWYSFRVVTQTTEPLVFRILNAGFSSAAGAWPYNQPVVSRDGGHTWRRISDTEFDGLVFAFRYLPSGTDWIALSPVYSYSRWLEKAALVEDHPRVRSVRTITRSLDGNPIHLVEVTDPDSPDGAKTAVWLTARQHPAESGGSWAAEGFMDWLLSDDPQARELCRRSVVYLVPFMNPDGVVLGNYRVNRAGVDLNRVWNDPNPAWAPSVAAVEDEMEEFSAGDGAMKILLDFHSHSSWRKNCLVYNTAANTSEQMEAEIWQVMVAMNRINPDFTAVESEPGGASVRLQRWWAYDRFGIHAVTLESSYQDVTYGPHAGEHMTVERYRALGEASGRAVAESFYGIPTPVTR